MCRYFLGTYVRLRPHATAVYILNTEVSTYADNINHELLIVNISICNMYIHTYKSYDMLRYDTMGYDITSVRFTFVGLYLVMLCYVLLWFHA